MVPVSVQKISRKEVIDFNFFVFQPWEKSGFYSRILLDLEDNESYFSCKCVQKDECSSMISTQ